jgi:anaerobic selenocysteine-containing dehydrogenase
MHILFRDGYADRDYMAEHTDDPVALEAHLQSRTPDWAASITGIDAADIVTFAQAYGTTERALIRAGMGFSRSRNGAASMHAVNCLPAVRGAWKHRGGGLYTATGELFGLDTSSIIGPETDSRWQ